MTEASTRQHVEDEAVQLGGRSVESSILAEFLAAVLGTLLCLLALRVYEVVAPVPYSPGVHLRLGDVVPHVIQTLAPRQICRYEMQC